MINTRAFLLFVILIITTGCTVIGPTALKGSRTDYNKALRVTEDEQMLLNIVRLRYRDRMLFLEPNSVNTQFSYSASVEPSISWLVGGGSTESVRNRLAVEERPTITYRPLSGKEFVERILTPIQMETLVLLSNSGWPISRVLRACVEQINHIENGFRTNNTDPTANENGFERFIHVVNLLQELEFANVIVGAKDPVHNEVVLRFREAARQHPAFIELSDILGFDRELEVLPLIAAVEQPDKNKLTFVPRSFDGIMFFLSLSVDVPEQHVLDRRVMVRRDAQGNAFDEKRMSEGLFHVRFSETEPETPAVKIFYRGHWFYIDDSDLASKSTFSLLTQVFALQSGNTLGAAPILTIPIGN